MLAIVDRASQHRCEMVSHYLSTDMIMMDGDLCVPFLCPPPSFHHTKARPPGYLRLYSMDCYFHHHCCPAAALSRQAVMQLLPHSRSDHQDTTKTIPKRSPHHHPPPHRHHSAGPKEYHAMCVRATGRLAPARHPIVLSSNPRCAKLSTQSSSALHHHPPHLHRKETGVVVNICTHVRTHTPLSVMMMCLAITQFGEFFSLPARRCLSVRGRFSFRELDSPPTTALGPGMMGKMWFPTAVWLR